jgi:hypothetical protein
MGILSALQGNYNEAAIYFRNAIDDGNKEAVNNLTVIGKNIKHYATN